MLDAPSSSSYSSVFASKVYDRMRPTSHIVEKGVIWLRDERNSLALKITLLALSIVASVGISTIGFSLLPTSPLLGTTLVFFPSFFWAGLFIVNSLLGRKVEKESIQYSFESTMDLVGGETEYLKIPELDIYNLDSSFWSGVSESDRVGNRLTEDNVENVKEALIKQSCQKYGWRVLACRLKPEHLTESLMKWKDFMGRRFISFKLPLDKENPSSKLVVFTLCETSKSHFNGTSHWSYVLSDTNFNLGLWRMKEILSFCRDKRSL